MIYSDLLQKPSSNFQAVRDGRASMPFYIDVDLTTARVDSAGTGLMLNIAGNSFYIDANPTDGTAFVEFQDNASDGASVNLYCSPGVIFKIPFTQLKIVNSAQAGKKIRIVYGVDVDFYSGSVAQVAVSGSSTIRPEGKTGNYASVAVAGAGAVSIFTNAQNPNGVIILGAGISDYPLVGCTQTFIANTASPANVADGDIILASTMQTINGASSPIFNTLTIPQFIAAGIGLYFYSSTAGGAGVGANRYIRWRAL